MNTTKNDDDLELFQNLWFPVIAKSLTALTQNLNEMHDVKELRLNDEHKNEFKTWLSRFINDEIDRLNNVSNSSDPQSIIIEMARLYSFNFIAISIECVQSYLNEQYSKNDDEE